MHDRLKYYDNLIDTENEINRLKNGFFEEIEPKIEFVLKTICKVAFDFNLDSWDTGLWDEDPSDIGNPPRASLMVNRLKNGEIHGYGYCLEDDGNLLEDIVAEKFPEMELEYLISYQDNVFDLFNEFPFDWLFFTEDQIKDAMKNKATR